MSNMRVTFLQTTYFEGDTYNMGESYSLPEKTVSALGSVVEVKGKTKEADAATKPQKPAANSKTDKTKEADAATKPQKPAANSKTDKTKEADAEQAGNSQPETEQPAE